MGPSIDIDLSRYDKTFQVNLRGPLVWTQAAWQASMRDHGGVVINVASIGGIRGEAWTRRSTTPPRPGSST